MTGVFAEAIHVSQSGDELYNVRLINEGWLHGTVRRTGESGACFSITTMECNPIAGLVPSSFVTAANPTASTIESDL